MPDAGTASRGAPNHTHGLRADESAGLELWRARRVGVKFRRQVILGNTIVDFFAPEHRLAIEVDGAAHAGREAHDRLRDAELARHGVRTLRVKAWEVERDLPAVLARIREALA